MSDQIKKVAFGSVNDNDEALKGRMPSGNFGLNQGSISKLEINENAGEAGAAALAVDIHAMIGDREQRGRIYDVTRVYDNKNNILTDETSPEYIKSYNETMMQNMGVIIHAVKSLGVTQQQLDTALATPAADFKAWAQTVVGLVPPNYQSQPVDIFLEYQWNIPEGQTRTFLQLPKNMKGGRFFSPSIVPVGSWEEQREWTEKDESGNEITHSGLRYVDKAGNIHPFTRSQLYMESPKGNLQDESAPQASPMAGVSNSEGQKKSTW